MSLSDYITIVSGLAIIVLTVLGIMAGSNLKGRKKKRYELAIGSIGTVAAVALIGSVVIAARQRTNEAAHCRSVREQIGKFIAEDEDLQRQCQNALAPVPDVEKFKRETESFLRTNLGESYVARFRDGVTTLSIPGDPPHSLAWSDLHVRNENLETFIHEFVCQTP
jgi:hypothetical protein